MKKTITGILMLLALTSVYAQTPNENDLLAATAGYSSSYPPGRTAPPYVINIKALRDFYKTYGDGNNESWYTTNYGFRAKFRQNGIAFMADYNKKGVWLSTIKTYNENNLPKDTRARIRREYYDQQILLVQEINRVNETVYLVNLGDNRGWMTLRLAGDEMETIAAYEN